MNPGRFVPLAWLDLAFGLWLAIASGFANGSGRQAVLLYGICLICSGILTRIAAILGEKAKALRTAWVIRAILYAALAASVAYVLWLSPPSSKQAGTGEIVFYVIALALFLSNSALSLWLSW